MAQLISWKLSDDDKILLSLVDDAGKDVQVEMPDDMYKEILLEGPPTEAKIIRELIDKINKIKEKRVLTIEKIDEDIQGLRKGHEDARDALKKATEKVEVLAWSGVLRSLAGEKAILQERRHIVKLLYQEEGKLRAIMLTYLTKK